MFLLICQLPASASLIVSAGSSMASPGTSGDSFDVTLTNTGPNAVTVAAFSFGLLLSAPDVHFTQANASTADSYIFSGGSLFAPVISTTVGSKLIASDLESTGLGVTVGSGITVGLGHVLFDIAPSAAGGKFDITISGPPTTSLSDPSANDVPITSLINGSIQVLGVPEPATAAIAGTGLLGLALFCRSLRTRMRRTG
jgi:hypothetical protein